jgi:hypothetical protein
MRALWVGGVLFDDDANRLMSGVRVKTPKANGEEGTLG